MDNFNISTNNPYIEPEKKNFFKSHKIIFLILGLIILIEVIYAVRVLIAPASSPALSQTEEQPESGGKISLTAARTAYNKSDIVSISVKINTGRHDISGADLIVSYNPQILEASSSDLIKGNIFDEYPLISADQSKGIVSISGIAGVNNRTGGFKGSGEFAVINFKAKKPGSAVLAVSFQKGSTTESNLVEAGTSQNILEAVDNLEIEVQ